MDIANLAMQIRLGKITQDDFDTILEILEPSDIIDKDTIEGD